MKELTKEQKEELKRLADEILNLSTEVVKDYETNPSEMSLTFSLYNAYNRKNAYTITFEESKTNSLNTDAVRLALFGIVPSLTFNFSF